LALVVFANANPLPPAIPQAFSTAWTLSVSPFFGGTDLIAGYLAVNYPKDQGYLELQDTGATPYQFQTSVIGVPINSSFVQGYSFLSVGRCWTIPEPLPSDYFHYFPLSVPRNARFVGNNTTPEGETYGIWSWQPQVYGFSESLEIGLRYSDGGVVYFQVVNSVFIEFTLTWRSSQFNSSAPDDALFTRPPGPCPFPTIPAAIEEVSPIHTIAKTFATHVNMEDLPSETNVLQKLSFALWKSSSTVVGTLTQHHDRFFSLLSSTLQHPNQKHHKSPTSRPTPPTIKPYFSASYQLGYGILNKTNNYRGLNYQVGYVVFDSTTGGAYINSRDDSTQNVPWELDVNFISTPTGNAGQTNDFVYLSYGRCWNLGPLGLINAIPLSIPKYAKYAGQETVDGTVVDLWNFIGSEGFVSGNITVATAAAEKDGSVAVVFIQATYPGYSLGGAFVKFADFDDRKPNPNSYAYPIGPCIPLLN